MGEAIQLAVEAGRRESSVAAAGAARVRCFISGFPATALPECDFKYFSNSSAMNSSENEPYHKSSHSGYWQYAEICQNYDQHTLFQVSSYASVFLLRRGSLLSLRSSDATDATGNLRLAEP